MTLSARDRSFLLERLDPLPEVRAKLESAEELTEDEADDLRDLVADRLLAHGFDSDYKPTTEGRELERLIDVLYTG